MSPLYEIERAHTDTDIFSTIEKVAELTQEDNPSKGYEKNFSNALEKFCRWSETLKKGDNETLSDLLNENITSIVDQISLFNGDRTYAQKREEAIECLAYCVCYSDY